MKRLLVIGSLLFFLGIAYVGYAAVSVPDVTSLKKTNPKEAAPGTIRGDLALETGENLVHGSDSPESAAREIEIFFPSL